MSQQPDTSPIGGGGGRKAERGEADEGRDEGMMCVCGVCGLQLAVDLHIHDVISG